MPGVGPPEPTFTTLVGTGGWARWRHGWNHLTHYPPRDAIGSVYPDDVRPWFFRHPTPWAPRLISHRDRKEDSDG